ncbi:MAG TPA: alpha/beta hydrolase [Nitrososphaerales archaeon]|nr:alpha/beta hydrolase [Nitrososphaerales archaeon]
MNIQGLAIAYEELGYGKTIVFVHGACENSLFWNHQKILSDRFRIVTLDLPGHGKSQRMEGQVSVKRYSDIVAEFVAKTCPDKAVIVGHSMGGAVALTNVIEHPEILKGIVLVATGAKLGVLPSIREGLKTRFEETVKTIVCPRQFSSKTNLETIRFVTDEILKCKSEIASADYEACNGFDVRQKLQSITLPALIIVGEEDKMTPATWSTYMKENIPKSKIGIIRDASHLPMLERPSEFNRFLSEFVISST